MIRIEVDPPSVVPRGQRDGVSTSPARAVMPDDEAVHSLSIDVVAGPTGAAPHSAECR
ncbi:hypothetical protein GCM10027053_44750 [Intrasporangium mesophilum]